MNWYEILLGLYQRAKIDATRLDNAVVKGLITEEQKQFILAQ